MGLCRLVVPIAANTRRVIMKRRGRKTQLLILIMI
uniref:Uncharacterized protein n=1 Tax=Rhizophora mucronata TaxID=61149 RepID=A0A2P2NCR7_RHIMU